MSLKENITTQFFILKFIYNVAYFGEGANQLAFVFHYSVKNN